MVFLSISIKIKKINNVPKRLEDIIIIRSNRGRLPKNEKNGFVRNQNDGKNLRTARILFGFGKTVRADKNDPLQNYGLNPPLASVVYIGC